MTTDNNENSLQKRFSSDKKNNSESNFYSERKRSPRPKRNDNILSSDDYSISETEIEYNPKRRKEFNNRKDDRRNDRDSSIKRNNSERPYSDNHRNNSERPYSNRKNNSSSENKDYNDSKRPYNNNDRDSSIK
ncbi:MAG: hypothetical protein LBP67_01950, partial [Bacteroidales bacterium]|nr:hypothetical protein [Bacteroidales bacterium]